MPIPNQKDILSKLVSSLKNQLSKTFQDFDVSFAYLSGSWVKGQQSSLSDIDIFVSYPQCNQTNPEDFLHWLTDINRISSELMKSDILEISVLERTPLHVQFQAISEGILIFEQTKKIRINYVENLLKLYYDHRIWYQKYLQQAV